MAQARLSPFDDSAMTDVPVSLNATEYTVEPCGTRPFVRAGVRQDLSRRPAVLSYRRTSCLGNPSTNCIPSVENLVALITCWRVFKFGLVCLSPDLRS